MAKCGIGTQFSFLFDKIIHFQQLKHISLTIWPLTMILGVGVANLFVYCYFGKLASQSFERMTDRLNESNWYDFNIKTQKTFILMIRNMQRPIYYHAFHVSIVDLETFQEVSMNMFWTKIGYDALNWHWIWFQINSNRF